MNMQFLNASYNVPSSIVKNTNNQQSNIQSMFQIRRRIQPLSEKKSDQPVEEIEKKRMIWGPAVWFLFHTLAEKVREEVFSTIRIELLNNIYSISVNLPCPMCATHAKEYLDKVNFNRIQTKEDLKNMLFQFHNEVNKRKNITLFPREELDEKYSKAVTVNIIHNFMHHFQDKYRSPKLIANDLLRRRIVNVLKEWFSRNISNFNL
jgi:hypothetical protein